MLKKIALVTMTLPSLTLAATAMQFYQTPLANVQQQQFKQTALSKGNSLIPGVELQRLGQTRAQDKTVVRYQQYYKGIPIVGAQIMAVYSQSLQGAQAQPLINGQLFDAIDVATQPAITSSKAEQLAQESYLGAHPNATIKELKSSLQIRVSGKDTLKLTYLVSFKNATSDAIPQWPFFIIDANTGKLIKQWNNIKTYEDTGAGGNDLVHEYWYGKDGLPGLFVMRNGDTCEMDDGQVRLVNLNFRWDWNDALLNAYEYPCDHNKEDVTNGAFSPINDGYYFGHTVVAMYKDWYGLHALQNQDGQPMPLIMRVHFGRDFDNAFWDGRTMTFGDGSMFYPLVSLDVAGHEVSHGFTEQHSGLEYHDQSGALNESFSDMAGIAVRAYLLEQFPALYNKAHLVPDTITWGIGETIVKEEFGYKALRFMDEPSRDDNSADCVDKALAEKSGATCKISYSELVAFAEERIPDLDQQQSYIVHTASGIFNKAFYLLSQQMGVKKAYQLMLTANANYWTPTSDFTSAACAVVHTGKEQGADSKVIETAFAQVGIATQDCP